MTPQRYRYTGAVESYLNYPRTEYGAPTGSCARDRASTKTHFESRLHVDLVMSYVTRSSVQVRKRVQPPLALALALGNEATRD